MKNYSKAWYDALAVERFTQTWPSVYGPRAPIMPFIALPLPPEVRGHFREAGELHHFQPGDSIIEGTVINSILGRGVRVKKGAVLKNAIIGSDASISENIHIENAIVDKEAQVIHVKEVVGTADNPLYIAQGDIV